ncbi:hypothetical protein FZC33_00370 [Labrys sp. KNU-23]|uniref:hypothetical protein n=1 Tax=Labrys sp. KNU-23 TaxID=2789216 RepID=UPI0011EBC4EC|nr:hypothetical protein [Labrys sp. KNU-23]QEN84782.1 hypothetical protein FZC33_00370 [Labrys sp. KNU-23]
MRRVIGTALAVLSLGVLAAPALAGQKCHSQASNVSLCDGCAVTIRWTVVRIQRGPDDNHFCVYEWRNLGGLLPSSVIQAPHLGTAKFKDYRVEYRGEKLGHDSMVVMQSWRTRTNTVRSATVTYDINVVNAL